MLLRGEVGRAVDGRARRVIDRAQEAGDVARRRRLAAAFFEAAARLALEVEDVGVVLGDQHLAEMEVAMMADLQAVERRMLDAVDIAQHGLAVIEQVLGELPRVRRQVLAQPFEQAESVLRAGAAAYASSAPRPRRKSAPA